MLQENLQNLLTRAQASQQLALSFLFSSMEIVRPLRKLVHALQLERGSNSLLLVDSQNILYASRVDAYRKQFADDQMRFLQAVEVWQAQMEQHALPSSVYIKLAHFLETLNHLANLREQIDTHEIKTDQAIDDFSSIIASALAFVFELAEQALDADIARGMLALFNFMQAKELAGQERALGVVVLGSRARTQSAQLAEALKTRIDQQWQAFQLVRSFATDAQIAQLEQLKQQPYRAHLEQWRDRVSASTHNSANNSLALAEGWFDLMTQRIDGFQALEDDLISYLQIICAKKMAADEVVGSASTTNNHLSDLDSQLKQQVDERVMRVRGVSRLLLEQLHEQAVQLGAVEAELMLAKQTLLDRRFIERAKALLMIKKQITEEQAHQFMRNQAMKSGLKMVDLAKQLLQQLV